MGIERILNERFPNLGSIVAVNTAPKLTSQDIDQSLEKLLPAIRGLGGVVVIKDVDSEAGKVLVDFSGPPRLKTGIELVLKDNPLVKEVVFNVIA